MQSVMSSVYSTIEPESWPRRRHFELFRHQSFPYLAVTVEVEVGHLLRFAREGSVAFFDAVMFCVLAAANEIEEFRYRIVGDEIRLYERVGVSSTLLAADGLFRFAECDFDPDFEAFARASRESIAAAQQLPELRTAPRPDLIYVTCLPWLRFTHMTHPADAAANDSMPRFAWGRFCGSSESAQMPMNVQVHHGFIDGVHLGRFFDRFASCAERLVGQSERLRLV